MIHTMRMAQGLFTAILVVLLVAPAAEASRSKDEIVRSLAGRYSALHGLISAGKVGETFKGAAEVVDAKYLTESITIGTKKMTIKEVIEAENKDRREIYAIIAAEQKTTPESVALQNGQRKKLTLTTGQYFKDKLGKWTRIGMP